MDALSTEKDKELHERLLNVINRYYENIDLFDKQKESLQKLFLDNANNLLDKTNSTSFSIYLPNYRNYANFLVDNYYKNENNSITTQISMKKTQQENEKLIEKIKEQYENLNISQNSLDERIKNEITKNYLERMTYDSLKMSYKTFLKLLFINIYFSILSSVWSKEKEIILGVLLLFESSIPKKLLVEQ